LTFLEAVAVAAVLFISLVMIWPWIPRQAKPRSSRVNCVSRLKQIGLALRMWSNDNGDQFPWQVSCETNGTLEFAESTNVFHHFLALSNELSSPKVLACTSDMKVSQESDWTKLNNTHLSYFVGLDSNEAFPQTILSGDRNITGGVLASNGIMRFGATNQAGWGTDLHNRQGNIGLADGSAQQFSEKSLPRQFQSALLSTNVAALRFSIPKPN
jgi:hypothetical protein